MFVFKDLNVFLKDSSVSGVFFFFFTESWPVFVSNIALLLTLISRDIGLLH